MNILLENTFLTPLGNIFCGFSSSKADLKLLHEKSYPNGKGNIYESFAHQIELITFKQRLPLPNGDGITDCQGWIFRIRKLSPKKEDIELFCKLMDYKNVSFDIATGEHLDAVEIFNENWILHIGTEDQESLQIRAKYNDWMPTRFASHHDPFTLMPSNGLITKLPLLEEKEQIHIQYLAAYGKRDITKVNTWLAVEEWKGNLEKYIGIL